MREGSDADLFPAALEEGRAAEMAPRASYSLFPGCLRASVAAAPSYLLPSWEGGEASTEAGRWWPARPPPGTW